jgi:L-ribulose-5-phosphate 3-epimerase
MFVSTTQAGTENASVEHQTRRLRRLGFALWGACSALKKGVNQLCFPQYLSVEQMLTLAADAGFDGFELSVGEEGEMGYARDPSELASVALQASRRGLELHSISTILHWTYPLSSVDRSVRERGLAIGTFMLRAASVVGADSILIVPGVADPKDPYMETYRIAQESVQALSEPAAELGVRIGIENVWNRFLQSPLEMLRFIEEIGSPFVGTYLDVGNLMAWSYPQHWIQVLGDHIVKVHVKDFLREVGNIHGFTYLLHGNVPWVQVIRELKAVGYDDYLTAELSPNENFTERLTHEISESLTAIIEEDG